MVQQSKGEPEGSAKDLHARKGIEWMPLFHLNYTHSGSTMESDSNHPVRDRRKSRIRRSGTTATGGHAGGRSPGYIATSVGGVTRA